MDIHKKDEEVEAEAPQKNSSTASTSITTHVADFQRSSRLFKGDQCLQIDITSPDADSAGIALEMVNLHKQNPSQKPQASGLLLHSFEILRYEAILADSSFYRISKTPLKNIWPSLRKGIVTIHCMK